MNMLAQMKLDLLSNKTELPKVEKTGIPSKF